MSSHRLNSSSTPESSGERRPSSRDLRNAVAVDLWLETIPEVEEPEEPSTRKPSLPLMEITEPTTASDVQEISTPPAPHRLSVSTSSFVLRAEPHLVSEQEEPSGTEVDNSDDRRRGEPVCRRVAAKAKKMFDSIRRLFRNIQVPD